MLSTFLFPKSSHLIEKPGARHRIENTAGSFSIRILVLPFNIDCFVKARTKMRAMSALVLIGGGLLTIMVSMFLEYENWIYGPTVASVH